MGDHAETIVSRHNTAIMLNTPPIMAIISAAERIPMRLAHEKRRLPNRSPPLFARRVRYICGSLAGFAGFLIGRRRGSFAAHAKRARSRKTAAS